MSLFHKIYFSLQLSIINTKLVFGQFLDKEVYTYIISPNEGFQIALQMLKKELSSFLCIFHYKCLSTVQCRIKEWTLILLFHWFCFATHNLLLDNICRNTLSILIHFQNALFSSCQKHIVFLHPQYCFQSILTIHKMLENAYMICCEQHINLHMAE